MVGDCNCVACCHPVYQVVKEFIFLYLVYRIIPAESILEQDNCLPLAIFGGKNAGGFCTVYPLLKTIFLLD